jgi:hypothetical protein
MPVKLLETIIVGSVLIDLLQISFLHSPDTREKMGVQWEGASAICKLQENVNGSVK